MSHVVGNTGAPFNEILRIVTGSAFRLQLFDRSRLLAVELGVPEIQKDSVYKTSSLHGPFDVLEHILIQWRSRYSSQATIERLCDALRRIELNQVADELMNHFCPNLEDHGFNNIFPTAHPKIESHVDTGQSQLSELSKCNQNEHIATLIVRGQRDTLSLEKLALKIGSTDINYYPHKILGRGSTSIIYAGYFGNVKTLAAIKEISKKYSDICYHELDMYKLLDQKKRHPNIVQLFQWTEQDDCMYLAMEMATCDLRNFLEQNPNLDRKILLTISLHSINGLQFLHHNQIIHRNIKPENILIFESKLAKLGGFGISRKMTNLTSTMSISKGTENWMSPEAITALHEERPFLNSKALDIFCLGMTIYFTLSKGQHPFAKSKKFGYFTMMNIKDPDVAPEKFEVDEKDYAFLNKLMQKTPTERPDIDSVANHSIWKELS